MGSKGDRAGQRRRYRARYPERIRAEAERYRRRKGMKPRKILTPQERAEANRRHQATWRAKHPQANRETKRPYRKARRNRERMARKDAGQETYDRQEIYHRDGGKCHVCRRKVSQARFDIDHLIPLADGGPDTRSNVALAHPRCNNRRGRGKAQLLMHLL